MEVVGTVNEGEVDLLDAFAQARKVPLSHQVDLSGHAKAVTCISIEPAGNRLITGSLDYSAKIFDFGGMDSRHKAFRSIEIQDGYPVSALSHSPSGDRFIVGTGSSQPKIYDREGVELMKFVKGDMYLRDLSNTKGHTMEVTGVQWHPIDKNTVLTSSLDGSVRIWDLLGESTFGNLCSKHVLKIRGATGQNRVGATSCCYTPNGLRIIGGANDGSIHIWQERKVYSKPDLLIRTAHSVGAIVTSVMTSSTGETLASRGDDGTVRLWGISGQLSQSVKLQTPLKIISNLTNLYPSANVAFSPDDSLVCCGTSPIRSDPTSKSMLYFYEVKNGKKSSKSSGSSSSSSSSGSSGSSSGESGNVNESAPVLQIAVEGGGVSAIMVKWQAETNQILCSTSAGHVRVFFDPRISKKGAIMTAGRNAKKREKEVEDQTVVGEIYYPNALPLFKVESSLDKKFREKNDPLRSKVPAKQLDKGPGQKPNMSFFFTKFVTDGVKINNSRAEDPREALLAMDEKAKSDPIFFGRAYESSNPKNVLHTQTFEEEQEEFKKKQKRF